MACRSAQLTPLTLQRVVLTNPFIARFVKIAQTNLPFFGGGSHFKTKFHRPSKFDLISSRIRKGKIHSRRTNGHLGSGGRSHQNNIERRVIRKTISNRIRNIHRDPRVTRIRRDRNDSWSRNQTKCSRRGGRTRAVTRSRSRTRRIEHGLGLLDGNGS